MNSEAKAAYDRAYYAAHREEKAAYLAAYRAAHREEAAACYAAYYGAHGEERAAYNAAYRAAHPDMLRAHCAKRRALKKGASVGDVTAEALAEKRGEYGGICPYCNRPIVKGHFDHVVPLSGGGSHTRDNLAWVCAECNLKKNNKSLLEYMRSTI